MPVFCFPNPDALRLSLVSRIVPPEVAIETVRAETDAVGRIWVELPSGFPKDAISALTRIGVTIHGPGTAPQMRPVTRWAELLPLKPRPDAVATGAVMIEVPDASVTKTVRAIQRIQPQLIEVRLVPESNCAWIFLQTPPPSLAMLLKTYAENSTIFVGHSQQVWIELGWYHTFVEQLSAPPGQSVVLRNGRPWQIVPQVMPRPENREYLLPPARVHEESAKEKPLQVPIQLRLKRQLSGVAQETLWAIPNDGQDVLANLARNADERLLRRYRVCTVRQSQKVWTVIQSTNPASVNPPLLPDTAGYVAHESIPNLYLPANYQLTPALRTHVLMKTLQIESNTIVWLERNPDGGYITHRTSKGSFLNLSDTVRYTVAATNCYEVMSSHQPVLNLPHFVVETEPNANVYVYRHDPNTANTDREPTYPTESWLGRSIKRVAGQFFRPKLVKRRGVKKEEPEPIMLTPANSPPMRVLEKLSSPHSLLMGNEWTARRLSLEQRILTDLPRLPPNERATLWTELADVYNAVGNPIDSAVCWLNAIWDQNPAPHNWLAYWLAAESRSSRLARVTIDTPAVLVESQSAQAARVAVAYLCWASVQSTPPQELATYLSDLTTLIIDHEEELPARGVWLARMAVAKLTDGDTLGLARCRDRIFQRLLDKGPGLDLDAPSFLRFRGTAAGERFSTAREWLIRIREPIHRWLNRLTSTGRLQWAGLDGELNCTTAYADLMVAWGLSVLGDRARSKELETHAARVLYDCAGAGIDPMVHRILFNAFIDRIRAAQDGRVNSRGIWTDLRAELGKLDDVARYAVEKLRSTSTILEPNELVNAYQGQDLIGFLSTDQLGQRLTQFLSTKTRVPAAGDGWKLLAIDQSDPQALTMPRIIFTLLEASPFLDPQLVAAVIPQVVRAIELIPEWVRIGIPHADATTLMNRFGRRMLVAACHAATLFHLPHSFRSATEALIEQCVTPDAPMARLFEPIAGQYFHCLRRLGLNQLAAVLLSRLRGGAEAGPRELGLTVGLFVIGDEDAGNRVLNAARDRLFLKSIGDDRERTNVAVAYANALAHTPPRIALGRLEELFLRLPMVATTGATNRYYTLKPLQLIDTVIRAVVSDDFSLGPGVRSWLDDDEFLIRTRINRELQAALLRDEGS